MPAKWVPVVGLWQMPVPRLGAPSGHHVPCPLWVLDMADPLLQVDSQGTPQAVSATPWRGTLQGFADNSETTVCLSLSQENDSPGGNLGQVLSPMVKLSLGIPTSCIRVSGFKSPLCF